jgi:hypothetical protein
LVASDFSSVDGEFSIAPDDDVNGVHQLEGSQNNSANDKVKLSEVASNGVDCEVYGSSLSNDSDETESEEDDPVNKFSKQNNRSFSSNDSPDKVKLSEVASKGVDCEEDGISLSNDSDETESEEDDPVIKFFKQNNRSFSSNESPDNDKNYSSNDPDEDDVDDEDYVEIIPNSSKASRPKATTDILFTTGLGFNAKKQSELRTVVESAASKNEFSQAFKPDKDLYCLVFRWARKPPYHFAADILNSNAVVSREAGLSSPFHLCQLRGWIITRRNPKSSLFHIQYKRFHECLTNAKFPVGHKALNLNGMIQKVYKQLDTCVLPPPTSIDLPATTKKESPKAKGIVQSAAKKRKNSTASRNFELIHAHNPSSFKQRLTYNTKCLQIGLFLMDFIFASTDLVGTEKARVDLYFALFSTCYSSRRFLELCHALLVYFDTPVPNKTAVNELSQHVRSDETNMNVYDFVMGKVTFGKAQTTALFSKIKELIQSKFPLTSTKKYAKRRQDDQLAIMRYVVITMFIQYKGNEIDNSTPRPKKPRMAIQSKLATSSGVASASVIFPNAVPPLPHKKKIRVVVTLPSLLNEVSDASPTLLDDHSFLSPVLVNTPVPAREYESYYSEIDSRFDPKLCRMATFVEVAAVSPRVYVEGEFHETNLYCAPFEFYLLRDLKNKYHGFKCDDLGLKPTVGKRNASLDIPMAVSYVTDDVAIIRPGHPIFSNAFSKQALQVNLPVCLEFVLRHGTSNRARDGCVVDPGEIVYGSRVDFGCAGSGSTEITPGVWRPDSICGIHVLEKIEEEKRIQIKACFASVYDCIQVASDGIQKSIDHSPLFNYTPRDDVYGTILRNYLGAEVMRNEWCTVQVKCLSRSDQTARHKDVKNCCWPSYDKTGALCFILVDASDTFWSIKFLSNSRQVIGIYFDKVLGMRTLCRRAENHFAKLDAAYSFFLEQYQGSYKPSGSNSLSWRHPSAFFLDDRCDWGQVKDTGDNDVEYTCIILPTIVVRDFWLSPAVHIICEMRSLGYNEKQLLELIVLGAYQTSWFRFFHIGMEMIGMEKNGLQTQILKPFETYIRLAEETFGSITGGPKPRADPPGLDVRAVYFPNQFAMKESVFECLLELLNWVNDCPEVHFSPESVRAKVLETSRSITCIKKETELGEFRLMLILQLCALSSVVLHSSPKLLKLLYRIPGKGASNHLIDVNVQIENHQDAMKRLLHHFDLHEFGMNAGESILCETLPGRKVFDAFFQGQSLFLLDPHGQSKMKKYASLTWETVGDN